jgi:predicted nucleotidyltransferase
MDLTEQQVREIRKWAQRAAPYVETVHLYGSRAKGSARPDSDVDLASTASVGNYVRFADEWQRDLSDALKLDVRLAQYNCRASDAARRACDDHGRK